MVEAALLTRGWHLSKEGLEQCKNGLDKPTVDHIIAKALDIDLRHLGVKFLPPDLNKGKVELLQGPCVVQIQKVRNVAAPKFNEDSTLAPSLLRLQLSDGHGTCFALVMHTIQGIGLSTTPGTKLQLKGSVAVNLGFLLLTSSNAKCLGGNVDDMVARWQLQKSLAQHTRVTGGGEGGPPPWVQFGARGKTKQPSNVKNGRIEIKKSLETKEKPKELTEQDKEFEEQRKATIEEVRKAKGQSKTFGGAGGKVAIKGKDNQGLPHRSNSLDSSKSWSTNGTKDEERSNNRNDSNYRDLSSYAGGFQPSNQSIQQLMGMGFTRDACVTALKKHSGNVDQAVDSLLDQSNNKTEPPIKAYESQIRGYEPPARGYAGRGRQDSGRRGGGRMGGRGRGSRDQDEQGNEDGDVSAAPSGPSTLFDFLATKLPKDKQSSGSRASGDTRRNYANEQPKSVKEAGIKFVHDHPSDRGSRPHNDKDYGNRNKSYPHDGKDDRHKAAQRNRSHDVKDDRTRDGQHNRSDGQHNRSDGQHNRSDGPKGNRDSFKSGPGRGGYDERPPRFRNAASSDNNSLNRQRGQDRYERPDRTKRTEESDRQRPVRKFDSRNNQNSDNLAGRKFDEGRNAGDERKGRSYEGDKGGNARKFDEGRNAGDERKGRSYEGDKGGNVRKFDDRKERNYDNRENKNYDDRRNQNNRERDKTRGEHAQSYRNPPSSQQPQASSKPSESNKTVLQNNTRQAPPANKVIKDAAKTNPKSGYTETSNHNGSVISDRKLQDSRYTNGTPVAQELHQIMNNGAPPSPPQQQQQPMAVPALSPHSQPMLNQAMTMMPPPHSLPVQPLPGQPTQMVVVPPQMLSPPPPPQQQAYMQWKQGDVCQAKYWEDGKFYNTVITAIHPSGKTCVVHFMEYGNYEEVNVIDIRPSATQAWIDTSQPPPSFQPPATMQVPQQIPQQVPQQVLQQVPQQVRQQIPQQVPQMVPQMVPQVPMRVYENFEGSITGTIEFRRGGEGSFRRPREDNRRINNRPTQNYYQPPPSVRR